MGEKKQRLNCCPNPSCQGTIGSLLATRDDRVTSNWYGWIICDWCGMQGPTGAGEDEAAELWNSLPR